MVRETRYLLVGNLPENVTEDEISEYFKRFSKIQSVKIHSKKENEDHVSATVAFADIKSASKANSSDNSIRGKVLTTAYSEGSSATGSVVKRTLDEPRPSYSANRPSSFPQRKGPEDGEVYEGRDYYSRGGESGQYAGYTENEYQRGRPRERFQGRGGFKQFDRGAHHQWTGSQRHFGERSNSSSDRDAFEKPKVPESPARSLSQTSRKSPKMKRIQSNSTSRSRSRSSDSSSSSSYSDSSSDSSRSRSGSGSRSSNHASRSKLTSAGSQVKSTRSRSQCSNASENTETTEGGSRPHGIRITNLPSRSSDTSLRDGLFHEYKKYGKVNAVQISGNGDGRYAIVSFKKSEDARKALVASQEKRFFGTTIRVAEHEGIDVDDAEFRPPEAELDEHHPKATRTLFVGNLEKEITMEELKEMFSKYGEILDIDVKRQGAISAYSFIQFTDIKSVVKALRALDGETMGGMKLKLGFGKSMPTTCVWVDNLADTVQENFLFRQFARYGPLSNMVIDRERGKALIFFNSLENAQFALNEMRNRILNGQKIQIDFASRDCQTDFYDKMEKSGQLKPGQRSTWNYQRQNSDGQQWPERGRGKFPFVRGTRGFVRGSRGQRFPSASGRGYSKDYPEDYRRQRSYDEYSQGGGTPYSEGDFESDLHAYRTQRERQRSCSPSQYSDEMYSESYREYKARYPEYTAGSPGSEPEEGLDYKTRDESFYRERYVPGSREGSPEGSFQGRSWSHSPARSKVKDSERNTPPTPLGGDDTQDFSSREHSPSDVDGKPKRSGKDDFDITEADIQELRTSNYSSAHKKESLSRSEERYSRKRSYDESFTKDSIPKDDSSVKKLDRQLSHGSHEKLSLSDSKRDLYQKVKKIQSEISGKMLARNSQKEGEGSANSSDSDPGSGTGGDLTKLHHERQVLIEKLKLFEDASNSENEHLDSEGKKLLSKRPRLDPWSSKRLQSELGSVTLGAKKDKSYDVSQSMRKQMEAIRKQEEKSVKDDSGKGSKKSDMFSFEDEKEENFIPHGLLSPKDVPTAFVKKRKKLDTNEENKNRMYRHKRENEEERMSSDNDDSAKNVLRTDSITSIGSNRRLSSGHSSPRTPITGHLSLETIEQRLSESEQSADLTSSMIVKKSDSKRRSKDEHSSPVIIPLGEDLLVTDIPDPRVPKQKREEEFCLPLPKFAEYTPPMKFNSSNSDNSGEHSKENSPCFSPPSSGSKNESPQMSPNDTTSEESQTVSHPEPTYIPEDNSSEHAIETLENQEMEVDKPPPTEGDIDDIMSDSSDHNDDFSLDERIRKLDEKLNQLPSSQPSKLGTENVTSTSSLGINISSSTLPTNVYSKYKIKKRQDSERLCNEETEKSEKPSSEIVKTMLNRSSIFDLDSKRLEQINEKYSPNMKLVVSNAEDSPKSLTLRTKAEAKEMPLSTLPGSLAGRLGNGGTSFPTLSINTQPLVVKIDDKPCNNVSPSSSKLYINDQNSQEGKTADTCSYNSDNRIFTVSDRMDFTNTVTTSFSQRFNSLDNGVNKNTVTTSTRTLVESVIESAEKSDNVASVESNPRDPRLKKDILYDNMDTNNKKLDLSLDNKVKKSPPILLENTLPKTDLKVDISTKSDSISDNIMDNKSLRSEINSADDLNNDSSTISLGKRKADLNSKKDKIKSSDNSSVSPTNSVKDHSSAKSDINSGSESPESKKVKLSSPEKDNKSETNSPTSNDSAKSDKLKKDNDKKSKDSKKKEQSEGDSVNKDKGYNDRKDKDHDGDKTRNSPKNSEQNDKTEDQNAKSQPENNQKETQSKLESKEADKTEKSQTKKESEKNLDHSNTKKEKKSDNSSKKSVEGKNDSSHKKESKSSTESKVKDKTKSSHKNKESKPKDNKTGKDGHLKSHSGKISKSGSAEKMDLAKDVKNSQLKDSSTVVESNDKKEAKESDNKVTEKPAEVLKDIKTEKTSETTAKTEKTSETAPKPEKSSDLSKPEKLTESSSKPDKTNESTSKPEKSSEPSSKPEKSTDGTKEKPLSSSSEKPKEKSVESKHKAKSSDNSKPKDKPTDSVKHKTKSESSEHKSKSSHDVMKKDKSDKSKHKDSSKTKEKSASSDTSKSKEKSIDSKTPSVDKPAESDNKGKSDSKTTDLEPAKSNEKTEDVKPKEKSGNGASSKVKDKSETDKTKSNEHSSIKPKERTKHSDNGHNKSKGKEEKSKPSTTVDKVKEKSPKDYNKKDDDHSKSDSKKDGTTDSKSSGSASKPTSENTTSTEKKEESSSNQDNKTDNKTESKSENKNDSKSENSTGNTESMAKNKSDTKKEKERKKSGESSKSFSKSSSKKSSSEKKSDSKSSDKKSSKKDSKKEEKTSPKEEKPKKQPAKKQEVEFDWSAWMDEPYVSMYDRVKRKSSEKDKEREMQEMKNRFNHLAKSRNKKHSKFSETEESDFSHDSDEETDAFEEEKVAKPSKEVSSVHDASAKRKRCVIDTSTSSDDDDSQLFKSFQKSTLNSKEKNKGTIGKSNKHSVNDIYSSDSSETDIDFPPISPAKKKTKKTKKAKKAEIHPDTDSDLDLSVDKLKKKKTVSSKPKPKSTPKKRQEPKVSATLTDTHESDLYDIDSELDIFDRIKLKNQKKNEQKTQSKSTPRKAFETTTDDSDNAMLSPGHKVNMKKKEVKPIQKSFLSDPSLYDMDSDSSFPDLSTITPKNNEVKKINNEIENKKPGVTVGGGVTAQTIRSEDLGQKNDEVKKKEKTKKKSKKNDLIKSDDVKKMGENGKGLFEKMENFISQADPKEKTSTKHSKKEGKSQNIRDMGYLDEEEINQAEKLVNNMNKLEKPMKHDPAKVNKTPKHDHEKTSSKTKMRKLGYSFSSETDTDKDTKSQAVSEHEDKSMAESNKEDEKKIDDAASKTKTSKVKKKKPDNAISDVTNKDSMNSFGKKEFGDISKKVNHKIDVEDVSFNKQANKKENDEGHVKKLPNKLEMDTGPFKQTNKGEKEEGYKIGFGFFEDFPMPENFTDDLLASKKGKKKKKEKEEDFKTNKKEVSKSDEKTPKKKEKKKKDAMSEMKENGPKLEELVGRLARSTQNKDVFDFPEEEEDDKPLFAEFFKKKEELAQKDAANKKDKPESKKPLENKLSTEEKLNDASSESLGETDSGRKNGQQESKSISNKTEEKSSVDPKPETEKNEDSIKSGLFSPKLEDGKIEDSSIANMFSPKLVKEACKDEAKNIMAFANSKDIDICKSDDENGKGGVVSPIKTGTSPKGKGKKDLAVSQVDFHSEVKSKLFDIQNKTMLSTEKNLDGLIPTKEETVKPKISGVSAEEEQEKSQMMSNASKQKKTEKFDGQVKEKPEIEEKSKVKEKPEIPEKSKEEIMLEAVSSLQKLSENTSAVTPEADSYQEGELVIDETTAAIETVTEEPELTEQAQNETDLAILSILPFDEKGGQFVEPLPQPPAVTEAQPEVAANIIEPESVQITLESATVDTSLEQNELVIDASTPQVEGVNITEAEKLTEKVQKSRKHLKTKDKVEMPGSLTEVEITTPSDQVVKPTQPLNPTVEAVVPSQPAHFQPQMYAHIQDPKLLFNLVPEVQKAEPYRKTRKQKANSKINHHVEVPGTIYPPVYNAVEHVIHLPNSLLGGDASEKENEEKMVQPYNIDTEKHDDMDNLRISGDEGGNSTDKRTRRGRKPQNYKELNSGVHGRTTSPRSRTSPRSPRAGMSPRQALSPLSSPKSELSSAVVKIERLPFGCNKNIRTEGELSNDAISEAKQQIVEAVENQIDYQNLPSTKKIIEEINKTTPVKEGTNVFDFDDNEPEPDTTPLKPTRQKKGRRNTQEAVKNPELKTTVVNQNHIVSPLESRWQCKKDSESEKNGNHPLKLTIALAHSTGLSASSIANVINSATIIDSTIPSIKGKKDVENVTKVSTVASSVVSSITPVTTITTTATSVSPKSNVDKIIDDVSKGIFNWAKSDVNLDQNKDQMFMSMPGMIPNLADNDAQQLNKKRNVQGRNLSGEQDMMPPPMTSPPGHEFVPMKSSPNLVQPPASPFGSMTMSLGRPPSVPIAISTISHTTHAQMGEVPLISYSQAKGTSQLLTTKNKPLDMAINMTSRADVMNTAHSLSTAAVVTQTTTTTIAQQSPGTSVVMSTQKPMVTSSGNTTVLAGRTVTVKPPNTEAYLHQMGLHPGGIPTQAPIMAHQTMPRLPENKQAFPPGFLPNFPRPDAPSEHSRPVSAIASTDKQPQVTSSAPTCVVHPITSSSSKTTVDAKLMHQQMMQAVSNRAQTVPTTSSQPIPPAHMQPAQFTMMEKEQLRNMATHGQPMVPVASHMMQNHIQNKQEKGSKGRQSQKGEMPQPNEPIQRPPSAHSQKSSTNEQQRPPSAHDNPALLQEQIRNFVSKGFIPHPQLLQMYHHQQQMAAATAKIEEKKGHKIHPPKEMVSPGIAHQPSSMFATSIASQSSNPQIKSPAVAQTAPSPHPVFSQPSTSQVRPTSPGLKKVNQNHWPSESPVDARNEAQRSRPTSVEPAQSPKHWGFSGTQQPKPAHQHTMDSNTKTNLDLEAVRLYEQHKQQEMLRMQQEQAKIQEIQRQEMQRHQQAMKSREGIPSTSATTSQQSERDRQTASVPGKPRSNHLPNHAESGPSPLNPRSVHPLTDLRGPRAFVSPAGEMIQGIPAHLYQDPEFQQRLHAAAALRMPHLLDAHLYPQGYPLGLPHHYLGQVGGIPLDHPHLQNGRPPSQGGMRSPPPRQAHQAVVKSPAIPNQNRPMPDPGEGSLVSLLQRYPVMWQGTLALKNDSCAVQMHVISGFKALVQTALPQPIIEGTCQPLRIAQRMRLEAAQLEGVIKRMQYDKDYCMLLALPCGSDHEDIIYQTRAMSTGFIQYLQQKQAAGIVNVADPGSQQPAYVVHIFPPCEFSHDTLGRLGFELLHQVRNLSHLLVIITTVA